MLNVSGVADVHDLHVWSLTSGMNALSAHVVRSDTVQHEQLLKDIGRVIRQEFPITHVTLPVESTKCQDTEIHL